MSDATDPETIGLAEAARRLREDYQATRKLLLTGELDGWKDGRFWRVTVESVARLEANRRDERFDTAAGQRFPHATQ